jgi:hypothetical protein
VGGVVEEEWISQTAQALELYYSDERKGVTLVIGHNKAQHK